jgi:hypothetical protein
MRSGSFRGALQVSVPEIHDDGGDVRHATMKALVSMLRDMGLGVDYWRTHTPRETEDLPIEHLLMLGGSELRREVEQAIATIEMPDEWKAYDLPEGWEQVDFKNALREILVLARCSIAVKEPLIRSAMGEEPNADETQAVILKILQSSANRAFIWSLVSIADNLAKEDEHVNLVPALFRLAIENAPRPNLHNELGAILLARTGLESDHLGPVDDLVLTAMFIGDPELVNPPELSGPIVIEQRSQLLEMASEAYARAYGYCVASAEHAVRDPDSDMFVEACYALDGLRVIAGQRLRRDLLEVIYWNYRVWEDLVAPDDLDEHEFTRRFSYGLGLSRTLESLDAVSQAESFVSPTSRSGLVEELALAVSRELRTASTHALQQAESSAATMVGKPWMQLPRRVQDLLGQARYLESIHWDSAFDWAPVALQYFRAVETLLREVFAESLHSFLQSTIGNPQTLYDRYLNPGMRISTLSLGQFSRFIRDSTTDPLMKEFMESTRLKSVGQLRSIAGILGYLAKEHRNLTVHGSEPLAGAKLRELKRLLFEAPDPSSEPLVWQLSELRSIE